MLNRTRLPSDIIAFVVFCRLRDRLTPRDLSEIMVLRGIDLCQNLAPGAVCDIVRPHEVGPEASPPQALGDYDAVLLSGFPLHVYDDTPKRGGSAPLCGRFLYRHLRTTNFLAVHHQPLVAQTRRKP